MKVWTFGDLLTKALLETDTSNETFAEPDELVGYYNDAVHEAESEILTIYEDYFLTNLPLTLVSGTAKINLPSTIYATKIRNILYQNGVVIYPVKKFKGDKKFLDMAITNQMAKNDWYRYIVTNDSETSGLQITLFPTPYESGALLTIWFIRNAKKVPTASELGRLTTDTLTTTQLTTPVDIPEFYTFICEVVKGKIRAKENQGNMPPASVTAIEQQRKMMVDSLTQKIPDDDDTILADFSHYWEHE